MEEQTSVTEEYIELYKEEIKKLSNKQVIGFLTSNVRNQQMKVKKYGMSKRQVTHVEKLSVHIQLLEEELLRRLNGETGNK